jgi:hypothetical protein
MTTVTSIKLQDHLRVYAADRPQAFRYSFAISSTLADNGDDVELFDIPAGFALYGATMDVSATLGASCTVQLRADTVALTAATTAGGADVEMQNNEDIPSASAARTVNLLVAGADISAGATVVVAGIIAPVVTITAPVDTVE